MNKRTLVKEVVQDEGAGRSSLSAKETVKTRKQVLTLASMIALFGAVFFFQACVPGYVETELIYTEDVRPVCPGEGYIWIEGDWMWSRPARTYMHQRGHWELQRRDRVYVRGYWQRTPRGHYWVAGRWTRQQRREEHGKR